MSSLNAGTVKGYFEIEDRISPAVLLAGQKVAGFSNVLNKLGNDVTSVGRDLLPLSAALIGAGAASTVLASTFEASMTRLVSIAGVSKEELKGVKEGVLQLAIDTGVGPQMLAEGMTKISSTVSNTSKAMDILKIAALGTKAGFGETVAVGGALTAVLNSYAATNLTAAQAGNIMAVAIKEGGAEAKELAPTLANVVPFAAQMGISFQEVSANIATLTKLGVPTAEAVTQLTSVMTALTKETKQGSEALTSVGLSYEQVRASIKEKGLAAALTELNEKFKGNTTGLADVFGRIEALRNIMGTAGVQAETYATVLGKINKAAREGVALQEMADAMNETSVQSWAELSSLVQVIAIKFGDALAPALKDVLKAAMPVLEFVMKAVDWFSQLPDPIKTTAIALGGFVGAAPLALMGIGSGINAVSGALKMMSYAITGPATVMATLYKLGEGTGLLSTLAVKALHAIFAAQRLVGTGWALVGGPIAAIVLAIGGVAYAWASYKDDWTRGFDVIIPGLGMLRDGMDHWTEAIDRGRSALSALIHGEGWDRFMAILNGFGKETLPQVKNAIKDLPAPLQALTNGLGLAAGASVVMGDGLDSAKTVAGGFREELAAVKNEVARLTAGEKEAIKAGLEMGKGQADIAARLHVSEAAVHLYAEGLHAAEQAGKKLVKTEKEIQKELAEQAELAVKIAEESWKTKAAMLDAAGMREMESVTEKFKKRTQLENDFDRISRQSTMSRYDFEVSEIQQWAADEVATLKLNYENWEEYAAVIDKISKQKLANLLKDNKEMQAAMLEFPDLPTFALGTGGMSQAPQDIAAVNKAAKAAAYDGMAAFFTSLGQISGKEGMGKFMQSAAQMTVGLKAASESAKGIGPLGTLFDGSASGAARFAAGVQTAAIVTQGAIQIWDAAGQATTRLGAAFNGAMAGASAGAAFGPWGAAAGAAVGVVASLFQDKVKKAVQEANVEIDKIRKGLIDTYGPMDELEKKAALVGMTFKNEWGHQGPEGLKKMKEMAAQLEDRLERVNDASKRVTDWFSATVKVLTKGQVELREKVDETAKAHSEAEAKLTDLMAAGEYGSQKYKDALEEVVKTSDRWKESMVNVQAEAERAKPQLDNLGVSAVAAFAAAYAATGDYSQALATVQPALSDLADAYEALDLEVENVALSHLLIQSTVAEGNPDLMAAIGGMAGGMQGLAQLGLLNIDTFHSMQETGTELYTRLQADVAAAGGTTRDALLPMQGYLQQAAEQARLLGLPLDANTELLIEQSKELGIWKEKGKSANDLLIEGMSTLVGKVNELLDKLLGTKNTLSSLPSPTVTITEQHRRVQLPDIDLRDGDGSEYAARGGLVTAGGIQYYAGGGEIFEPRGTDTVPAMLTPGERVLSVNENKDYERGHAAGGAGQMDPRMIRVLDRLANAITGQSDTMLIGLRDILLEKG